MQPAVKHLKGYCDGEHQQLTLTYTCWGERTLKQLTKDHLIFNSSDPCISFGILRGFKDMGAISNSPSPCSLQSALVNVKALDSYWHKFFMPDLKSIQVLFVK